jgi:hypothetical protein
MNNYFVVLGCLFLFSAPIKSFSLPVQPFLQVDEKPKKEILVSISSKFYKNPVQVIEGFFKQAGIYYFSIEDNEKLEKMNVGNFQFKNKTVDQAIKRLSSEYKIVFEVEEVGKDKVYKVKMR